MNTRGYPVDKYIVGNCGESENLFILLPLENYIHQIMSTFIGKYVAKADVKGRIFIPSVYRKILPEEERERVVMRRDAENDCLVIYPVPVWHAKVAEFKTQLDEWNAVDQLLLMQFVSDAEWLDLDNQGRVLISKKHLEGIAVENSEVLFVGMVDRFAVWSKAKFEQASLSAPDFAALLKERMMKK